jgi:hypothetical protein
MTGAIPGLDGAVPFNVTVHRSAADRKPVQSFPILAIDSYLLAVDFQNSALVKRYLGRSAVKPACIMNIDAALTSERYRFPFPG